VADLSRLSLIGAQPATYGPDTIADAYGAKVVLNDISDMYTKAHLDQTLLEAATWTKVASAPYPPAVRLAQAALYVAGEWTDIGLWGWTLILAAAFLAVSAWYFVQTRWYLFPLLYLNFAYLGNQFVYMQDGSYLVMLLCVMAALVLARRRSRRAPPLMAVATAMKLSPMSHARCLMRMPRRVAWAHAGILAAGLILPAFIWDGYTGIYTFATGRKGNDARYRCGVAPRRAVHDRDLVCGGSHGLR
jgi:hypothetical protein